MALSEKDVQYVAKLARLEVTDQEVAKYTQQLANILEYVEQLNKLDTSNVEPLSQVWNVEEAVTDMKYSFRKDELQPCLSQIEVLSNAPEPQSGHFKVPKIM